MSSVKEKDEYEYIKYISFSTMKDWSYYNNILKNDSTHSRFKLKPLSYFLKDLTNDRVENILDDLEYAEPTISSKTNIISVRKYGKGLDFKVKSRVKILKDDLVISRMHTQNGSFAFANETFYSTKTFFPISVNYSLIEKRFLELILKKTLKNLKKFDAVKRETYSVDEILELQIPLPSIPTQKSLVAKYDKELAQVRKLEQKVDELNEKIENYILEELGIISEKTTRKKGLNIIHFKDLDRWGVEYQLKDKKQYNNSKYSIKSVSDFIQINPRNDFPKISTDASFVPMECVSDEEGKITELKNGNTKNSKGYTKFQENDLIWAKITPCMQNGKSAIARNLENGIGYGSTEFHTFRAKEGSNIEFFYHLFRSKYIRDMAMSYFTGTAGQQRVPSSFFENLKMPLPSLDIQNKIAEKINNWKEEIKHTKEKYEILEKEAKKDFEANLFEI